MKTKYIARYTLFILCLLFAGGCMPKHNNAIFFSTNTLVGVKVGTDANQVPEIDVGYQRQEAAYVPVYVQLDDGIKLQKRDALVAQYLQKALDNLRLAYNNGALITNVSVRQGYIDAAKSAISFAQSSAPKQKTDGRHVKGAGSVFDLSDVEKIVGLLDAQNPDVSKYSKSGDYKSAIDLIEVQLDKPKAIVAFYEQGKFESKSSEDGFRRDAYSVLGTFSGNMDSGSSIERPNSTDVSRVSGKSTVKGGVAQYFATGTAAQLLAERGGAALVSSNAEAVKAATVGQDPYSHISPADLEAIQNSRRDRETSVDEVLDKLIGKNLDVLKPLLDKTNGTVAKIYTAGEIDTMKSYQRPSLRETLTQDLDESQLKDLITKL